jgi:transcription elongation factor GreA
MEKKIITPEGARKLREELEYLKGPAREALSVRLRTAIQHGDLSENADYSSAKEEQGFLEGRILELEELLKNAEVVDPAATPRDVVSIGCRVTVIEEEGEPEVFLIVGSSEADSRSGKISYESPMGRSLMNHRVGDSVTVLTPSGSLSLRIEGIE